MCEKPLSTLAFESISSSIESPHHYPSCKQKSALTQTQTTQRQKLQPSKPQRKKKSDPHSRTGRIRTTCLEICDSCGKINLRLHLVHDSRTLKVTNTVLLRLKLPNTPPRRFASKHDLRFINFCIFYRPTYQATSDT